MGMISIHASKKDATAILPKVLYPPFISIHASKKDATGRPTFTFLAATDFNPRIQEGCDRENNL